MAEGKGWALAREQGRIDKLRKIVKVSNSSFTMHDMFLSCNHHQILHQEDQFNKKCLMMNMGKIYHHHLSDAKIKEKHAEDDEEAQNHFIPSISINFKQANNPVKAISEEAAISSIKGSCTDLSGKIFVLISENLGEILSQKENPREVLRNAERLMLKKDIGMIPLGVTLGETLDVTFSESMSVLGYDNLRLNIHLEMCVDAENNSRNFPLLKLACSDENVPKELVLGRGFLVLLNRLQADEKLRAKFGKLVGMNFNDNAIREAIVQIDEAPGVFVIPDTIHDQHMNNTAFDEMLFIYGVGDELNDLGLFAGKINHEKYISDIMHLEKGINLNNLGIIASDIAIEELEFQSGHFDSHMHDFKSIIKEVPNFHGDLGEELKWFGKNIYLPGLAIKKKNITIPDNKIRITTISALRQRGLKRFGIGKITDLPDYVQNGKVIIRNFSDIRGYDYAGDPALIDWLDVIEKMGIKDMDLNSSSLSYQEKMNEMIDKAKIIENEMHMAMKIHSDLVNFKEFQKITKEHDNKYRVDMEDEFFGHMINYSNFEEYFTDFTNDKDSEFRTAERVFNEVIEHELSDIDVDKSKLGSYSYKSKEFELFLEKAKSSREKISLERIHRKLIEFGNFEAYKKEFEENKTRVIEIARKVFERVISTNRFKLHLDKFAKYKKELGYPGPYGQMTWLEQYAFLKSYPKEFGTAQLYYINKSISCMLQWLFALQMEEAMKKIHFNGGLILFEMHLTGMDDFSLGTLSYLMKLGFDGLYLVFEKHPDEPSSDFKKMLSAENFDKLIFLIHRINPSAEIFVTCPNDYLDDLIKIIDEGDPNLILARKLSELAKDDELYEEMLLEVDAGLSDTDLWKKLHEEIGITKVRAIAVLAGAAAGDPALEINDPNYRLPFEVKTRPKFAPALLEKLSPLIASRPKSWDVLARMGYYEGIRFRSAPCISNDEWRRFCIQRNDAPNNIDLADEAAVIASGFFGFMAALYYFFNNNDASNIFSFETGEKHVLTLMHIIFKNSNALNEENWPSGWLMIKNFEKMIARKSASLDEKIGYFVELFGFLRGILENMVRDQYMEKINALDFVHDADKSFLIALLTMDCIFGIQEDTKYDIPVSVYQQNQELIQIASAKSPEELIENFDTILQAKYDELYKMQPIPIVIFVKALLSLREMKENYQNFMDIPKTTEILFQNNALKAILNPIYKNIELNGIISVQKSQEDRITNALGWMSSELVNLLIILAERNKDKIP